MHCDTDESAGGPRARHPHIRAALPLLDDNPPDLETLYRVAAALRVNPDSTHWSRPGIRDDIDRLRRDMGDTIADLWAAPPEEVRYVC